MRIRPTHRRREAVYPDDIRRPHAWCAGGFFNMRPMLYPELGTKPVNRDLGGQTMSSMVTRPSSPMTSTPSPKSFPTHELISSATLPIGDQRADRCQRRSMARSTALDAVSHYARARGGFRPPSCRRGSLPAQPIHISREVCSNDQDHPRCNRCRRHHRPGLF